MSIVVAVVIIIVKASVLFSFDLTVSENINENNWLTYQQFGFIYELQETTEIYTLSFFWTFFYEAAMILSASIYMIFLMRLLKVSEKKIILERKLTRKIPMALNLNKQSKAFTN